MKLYFSEGNLKGKLLSFEEASIIIGRSHSCTLVINDPKLSGKHVELTQHDGEVWSEDLESHNGVYINGQKIAKASRVKVGDQLKIGEEVFSLVETGGKELNNIATATVDSGLAESDPDLPEQQTELSFNKTPLLLGLFFVAFAYLFYEVDQRKITPKLNEPVLIDLSVEQGDEIRLEQAGFSDNETGNVDGAVDQELEPECVLNISSPIESVSVEVNGDYKGELPIELKSLEKGFHYISVFKRAYHKKEFLLDLQSDQKVVVDLERDERYLDFQTTPNSVNLLHEGEHLALSPAYIRKDKLEGKNLTISLDSYSSVSVVLNDLIKLYELHPNHCSLEITLPAIDCEVNLNGKVLDSSENPIKLEKLNAGEYFLSIQARGKTVKEEFDLRIKAGEDKIIRSQIFTISHFVKLKSGEEFYGMLQEKGDRDLVFALEQGEKKRILLKDILSWEASSKAESLGISKGIEVIKKKILPLNENIWEPRKYRGPEREKNIEKFAVKEILEDKSKMDLLSFFEKYGNKYLEVQGTVTALSSNENWHTLRLDDVVECYFKGQNEDLSYYGKRLSVRAWSLGIRGLDMLVLTECELVE
ncbi:hypothetical protein LNTAR_10876 [Lentisphaera araneosa HTCC2155]|uniref:FHA domain-containing protein n=1 Tax=Lentisphaera araneosa HTCC2155 TaxID=313628 RepID=A6DIX8_9BACT|nr:FHA domain-containing protein [Lentisphaera araneosa]EDM28414.1 hypothetical protein LNTAR_10876 [Lentisphaera araneosa HTCC2155]